jgi:Zn-finger nucleic acid-binding protein
MKCPHCAEATLVMSERQGIEIDYCPQCRGVWLDRGELDKLIERSGTVAPAAAAAAPAAPAAPARRPDFVDSDFGRSHGSGYRKRKSWLSEIFD